MALSVKNMLGGSSSPFFPSVFATGVSQNDDVRLFKMEKGNPHGVPSEYQEVEYIDFTGTQYISLPALNSAITSAEIKYRALSGTSHFDVVTSGRFQIYANFDSDKFSLVRANAYQWSNSKGGMLTTLNHDYIVSVSGTTATIDGTNYTLNSSATVTEHPINIGTDQLISRKSNMRLYYFNLVSGNASYNLVPCYRKSNNEIGLYDTVSNTFYTNSGTGTFEKGNDCLEIVKEITNKKWVEKSILPTGYSNVEYIVPSGDAYIDTGFKATNTTIMTAEYELSSSGKFMMGARNGQSGYPTNGMYLYAVADGSANSNACISNTGTSGGYYAYTTMSINKRYVAKLDASAPSFELDNALLKTFTSGKPTGSRNLLVFDFNTESGRASVAGWGNSTAKLYSLTIEQSGNVVFNGIPCKRNSDNSYGLFDTVTNTFFGNSGTGSFDGGNAYEGYSFKLNELGMYRLSANNGSIDFEQDVLVDYPLEYVVPVVYRQYG